MNLGTGLAENGRVFGKQGERLTKKKQNQPFPEAAWGKQAAQRESVLTQQETRALRMADGFLEEARLSETGETGETGRKEAEIRFITAEQQRPNEEGLTLDAVSEEMERVSMRYGQNMEG